MDLTYWYTAIERLASDVGRIREIHEIIEKLSNIREILDGSSDSRDTDRLVLGFSSNNEPLKNASISISTQELDEIERTHIVNLLDSFNARVNEEQQEIGIHVKQLLDSIEEPVYITLSPSSPRLGTIWYADSEGNIQYEDVIFCADTASGEFREALFSLNLPAQTIFDEYLEGLNIRKKTSFQSLLVRCLGSKWDDVWAICQKERTNRLQRLDYKKLRSSHEQSLREDWSDICTGAPASVIDIDRKIDYTNRDFTVGVSLRTAPYQDQVDFVKRHQKRITEFVLEKLEELPRHMRKIGDMHYYRLSDVVISRSSQVLYIFSIRPEIERLLSEEE